MRPIHVYLALFALTLCGAVSAQPEYVNYQGFLKDDQGEPLATGLYEMEFNFYDDPSASDGLLWGPFLFDGDSGDGHAGTVSILNGRFNVVLGPKDTAGRDISDTFAGSEAYVEVKINGGSPILPRQQILTSPYAFHAKTADNATTADSATVAGNATTANSAAALTGTEWNAPLDTRAIVTIGGVEKLGIGDPGKGGNGSLDVSGGHVFVDENFGIFSTDEAGTLEAGFDTDEAGSMYIYSQGARKLDMTSDRFVPTVNATNITGGTPGLYLGASNRRWKAVYSVTGSIQTSDRRLKSNIQDLEYGLDEILKMRPTRYKWKSDPEGADDIGLIAQDVQALVPEAVDVGNDEEQTLGIMYSDLVPVLINAVQEQQKEIVQYEAKNEALENRVENLETQLQAITLLVKTSLTAEDTAALNQP